ncbi:MAG: polyprenyl diphosphate synthase [Nevskiales bacterium]|nr:polyprenyl diphosphate synthase [Nevskiales bacterium]
MTSSVLKTSEPAVPVPRHVAVIMDGNGRWASLRGRPRSFGHRAGLRSARRLVRASRRYRIEALTVFAFSQENWQRPDTEVRLLMQLFLHTLSKELKALRENDIRLRFIGEHSSFPADLRQLMRTAEAKTVRNGALHLTVAVGYSGRWDILQAAEACQRQGLVLNAENLEAHLQTAGLPSVDLLIRTGGERRISNFLLWPLAYTELYFTETLWPDFAEHDFVQALGWFAGRERRFGLVPEAA